MLRLSGPEGRLELAEDDGIGCRLVNDERLRIEAAYGFEPSAPDGSNCPPLEE